MAVDFKKSNAPTTTITRNQTDVEGDVGNIYEALKIIGKRANQISVLVKDELNKKLEEFASYTDSLEEIHENREQIEISRFYERLPKPSSVAMEEFLDDKVYYRNPEKEQREES